MRVQEAQHQLSQIRHSAPKAPQNSHSFILQVDFYYRATPALISSLATGAQPLARNKHHYPNLLNNGGGSFGDRMGSAVLGTVGDRRFTERSNILDECVYDLTAGVVVLAVRASTDEDRLRLHSVPCDNLVGKFRAPWWANLYTVVSSSLP